MSFPLVPFSSDSDCAGIDPHRVSLPDLKARAIIQAVDFSPSAASFHVLTASTLPSFLSQRPPSSKVRWLHVNGLSWDVLQPLAIEYGLHPLSLEDVLHHGTQGRRSKVDYFGNHLFVSVVVHRTEHAGEHAEEEDKDHKQTNLGSDEEREVQGRLGEVGSFERYAHLLDEAFKGAQDEEGKEGGSVCHSPCDERRTDDTEGERCFGEFEQARIRDEHGRETVRQASCCVRPRIVPVLERLS